MSNTQRRKLVQVLLTEEEFELVTAASARVSAKLGRQGRDLLLAWAAQTLERPGVVRGGRCGSSTGCPRSGATWWNSASKLYLCESCARTLNAHTGGSVCVENRSDPGALTDEVVRSLRSKAETSRVADDRITALVRDIRRVIAPYEEAGDWFESLRSSEGGKS